MNRSIEMDALLGGNAAEVAKNLSDFSNSAKLLSSEHDRLINSHEHQWVGVVRGTVLVTGESTEGVIQELKEKGVDPEDAIIRFIDRELKTLIL